MKVGQAKRLAWEGLVVVASILVAFALDAWWDARGASADLRRELISVQSELAANRTAIAERVRDHRLAMSSIEEVIRLVEQGSANSTISDSLLYRAFVHSPTSDPSTGGLDALISSGRLALLQDASLKSFLAGFRNRVEDVREDELGSRHVGHNVILPLIRSEPGIAEVLSHSVRIPGAVTAPKTRGSVVGCILLPMAAKVTTRLTPCCFAKSRIR